MTGAAGGVQHLLKMLGPVSLGEVGNFLEAVRQGGGNFQDLQKLVEVTSQAGGVSKVLKTLGGLEDKTKFS
eukprot:CAMPEP_0197676982 /NCGR_PEP_ID=MMETSP1338-20131121/87701_1 /TAXON_ID=43686 ORGANISM="Pelagodinium beii, Strain RCC1491" /NCGR_SAMPLE_ID=MMETSP1338 /ASSEMBLY_ACC=CAM_ASM_000754 /LENGTH=70 /DNA_ID=CAMNT_0043257757 /DNA_START=86 /DNA_END=295 /DNA_ORIENTATION=+